MFEQIGLWLVDTIGRLGYSGLLILMAMESSVLPVPAELVMPPAGYLAASGQMNIWIALLCGTVGSMVGAYANYWVASRLGRWVFVRYGRWVLLTEKSLERTERFFERHGEIATFIGRLFPVLRHLISIPAGIARMRLGRFFAYTGLGAAIWCAVLLGVGWIIGKGGRMLSREVLHQYSQRAVLWMVPAVAIIVVVYVWWRRRRSEPDQEAAADGAGGVAGHQGRGDD
jgi:membrane protein DedA with SNARE-associated domain